MEYTKDLSNAKHTEMTEEELFLSTYNIEHYERPSVATDIAAFSLKTEKGDSYRKSANPKLSLLLIKRGEHPFKNHWALPGGFLRKNETVEECAYREIKEETNLSPVSLISVGVFSDPKRDPRGWIVSNAFASIVEEADAKIMGGEDSLDAKWFEITFTKDDDGICLLTLKYQDIELTARLKEIKARFGVSHFEIIENDGLAFDHAKIIAVALSTLRKEGENFELAFDFLPEKFTLNALQKVQETLMGNTYLAANFRRTVASYVEETDEYTEGAGHRPARLFKRKK